MRFPFFFFLMIRRPPRSTLFPTRRSSDLRTALALLQGFGEEENGRERRAQVVRELHDEIEPVGAGQRGREILRRSEEHTSELQSPCNLVCRLLLEKKKTTERRCTCHIPRY